MRAFQILLVAMIIAILTYTGIVIANHGWNFFQFCLNDVTSMSWAGQFNLDFSCYLTLSGLWLAWRHNFTPSGIILGLFGFVGGIIFFAPYLVYLSIKTKGNVKEILIGKTRANS